MSVNFPRVLRDYALLADGERGALVGPQGELVWMSAPRWDSDAVFSLLIGGQGAYAITPTSERFVWGGSYEEGSLIWRGRWITTSGGVIECRDALAFPGDSHTAVILRRVAAVDGEALLHVTLDPRAGFGRTPWRSVRIEEGYGRDAQADCICAGRRAQAYGGAGMAVSPSTSGSSRDRLATWSWRSRTGLWTPHPFPLKRRGAPRKPLGPGPFLR